jgi:DNA-binding transcriptional LysR family regulator
MDRLEAMATFRAVVDKGSFTAAAKALGAPLATVSRRVAELEAHLGTRLLARSTRKLAVTDAGLAYVEAVRRVLDEIEEADRAAAGEYQTPRGELVLTAPILFGRLHILPVVTDFLAAHPDINLRMLLSDRNLHLIEDHVDLGVRIGVLPDSDLIATRVGTMRRVLCAAPGFLARHGAPKHPHDLSTLPCVSYDQQTSSAGWSFRDPAGKALIEAPIAPRLSATTSDAVVAAAVRGVGVTQVLHYQVADALQAGQLQIILRAFEPEPLPVHLIHAGRDLLPLKTRAFLDFAAQRLRAELAAKFG